MSHVPHEIADEFPDSAEKIHTLKISNAHFARLANEYHELNREIHRHETGVEPVSQTYETELRKKRMLLKDDIATMLAG